MDPVLPEVACIPVPVLCDGAPPLQRDVEDWSMQQIILRVEVYPAPQEEGAVDSKDFAMVPGC
eukprot:CAMPEP_0180547554 /NCGR_PEP_ID=MMETSP1036_2-20121128/71154_1 /TAXON_ID=632150 /ORGANISM="Azadinium spinosum, Strain 3D9" /LENGTH=62 /DNA_ID=CAMNT_0022562709 /DNA_START=187 /DNA_END=375 /DNA_ORIENTATION=+